MFPDDPAHRQRLLHLARQGDLQAAAQLHAAGMRLGRSDLRTLANDTIAAAVRQLAALTMELDGWDLAQPAQATNRALQTWKALHQRFEELEAIPIEALEALLDDADHRVRHQALVVLGGAANAIAQPNAVAAVESRFTDSHAIVRRAAANALVRLHPVRAVELGALERADADAVFAMLERLDRLPSEVASAALRHLAAHGNPAIQARALASYVARATPEEAAALLSEVTAGARTAHTRQGAIEGLAALRPTSDDAAMALEQTAVDALQDGSEQVRRRSATMLVEAHARAGERPLPEALFAALRREPRLCTEQVASGIAADPRARELAETWIRAFIRSTRGQGPYHPSTATRLTAFALLVSAWHASDPARVGAIDPDLAGAVTRFRRVHGKSEENRRTLEALSRVWPALA